MYYFEGLAAQLLPQERKLLLRHWICLISHSVQTVLVWSRGEVLALVGIDCSELRLAPGVIGPVAILLEIGFVSQYTTRRILHQRSERGPLEYWLGVLQSSVHVSLPPVLYLELVPLLGELVQLMMVGNGITDVLKEATLRRVKVPVVELRI